MERRTVVAIIDMVVVMRAVSNVDVRRGWAVVVGVVRDDTFVDGSGG